MFIENIGITGNGLPGIKNRFQTAGISDRKHSEMDGPWI